MTDIDSDQKIVIEGEERLQTGKGIARRLRRASKIPAVIVKRGEASVPIALNPKLLGKVWQADRRFILQLGKEQKPALLLDVQIDPVRRCPLHADIVVE